MANLPETPTYDAGVYQKETNDAALGGAAGKANAGILNLANRTGYLKAHVDILEAIVPQAEAEAGTATTLRGWNALRVKQAISALVIQATESLLGVAEIATQAETNAGTDDLRIVTPLKLRYGFSISLTTDGWFVFPAWLGGFKLIWGTTLTPAGIAGDLTIDTFGYPMSLTTIKLFDLGTYRGSAGSLMLKGITNLTGSSYQLYHHSVNDESSFTYLVGGI